MLSARLRVGDRMMGIGFIEGRLRTGWLGRKPVPSDRFSLLG